MSTLAKLPSGSSSGSFESESLESSRSSEDELPDPTQTVKQFLKSTTVMQPPEETMSPRGRTDRAFESNRKLFEETGKQLLVDEQLRRGTPVETKKDKLEGVYDDYYSNLIGKEGNRLRDIYPDAAAKKVLLLPDDPFKIKWEMMIAVVLIFTAIMTPYRLAFTSTDNLTWITINYIIDGIFFVDIILCFFTAFEDENEELVHDRCVIATTYLKTWFFVDIISVLPVSEFLQTSDFGNLARITRLPKLYRLIRLIKLMRLLKVIKERNSISRYLQEVLKLSIAIERLTFFAFMYMILVHITSCLWVIIAQFEDQDPDNLLMHNNLSDLSTFSLYISCFYFTTIIVATIGYGDITPRTPAE